MFCRYCGNDIIDDSIFCEVCGKRLKNEPAYQPPVKQEPIYQAPIQQAPVYQEPVQNEVNSVLYYYNNSSAETKPMAQEETAVVAYGYEENPAVSAYQPSMYSESEPKTEYRRDEEIPLKDKKKKGALPYILMPVSCVAAGLIGIISQILFIFLSRTILFRLGYFYSNDWVSCGITELIRVAATVLPFMIVIILFSLCCKGLYKKTMFIGSAYAAQLSNCVSMTIFLIVSIFLGWGNGSVYLYDWNSMEGDVFLTSGVYGDYFITPIIIGVINMLICPIIAFAFFKASQKYTIKKEEKASPKKLILPCIFLGVFGFMALGFQISSTWILREIFWAYDSVEWNTGKIIAMGATYGCLFLLALACKGGYKKVAFVGSALFSNTLLSLLPNILALIATLINWRWHNGAFIIGQVLQYLLAIPISIVLYIILNRYVVEKKKELQ